MGHGAPDVAGDEVDDARGRGGEPHDGQVMIHKHRRNTCAGQKIVHVVVDLHEICDFGLEFSVHRGQLFVHRLQLFLGCLQLFVGGLQLFIHRLHLLIGGFELFVGCLQLFVGGLKVFFLGPQLLLKHGDLLFWVTGEIIWRGYIL